MFTVHIGTPTKDNERATDLSIKTEVKPSFVHLEKHIIVTIIEETPTLRNRVFLSLSAEKAQELVLAVAAAYDKAFKDDDAKKVYDSPAKLNV